MYFSRLTLNRTPPTQALAEFINPRNANEKVDANHHLIWKVFSDDINRKRDFLWRYDGHERFFTLSERPPKQHDLFLPPETKVFDPNLRVGDRLQFTLRANATKDRAKISRMTKDERKGKSRRVDVVMDLLRAVPKDKRASERIRLVQDAAKTWMACQGAAKGFSPSSIVTEGYTTMELARKRRQGATFGVLDISGEVEVTDTALFLSALTSGIGRAKAWGCGLMLIRRAR